MQTVRIKGRSVSLHSTKAAKGIVKDTEQDRHIHAESYAPSTPKTAVSGCSHKNPGKKVTGMRPRNPGRRNPKTTHNTKLIAIKVESVHASRTIESFS
jgi:hypothetical protein